MSTSMSDVNDAKNGFGRRNFQTDSWLEKYAAEAAGATLPLPLQSKQQIHKMGDISNLLDGQGRFFKELSNGGVPSEAPHESASAKSKRVLSTKAHHIDVPKQAWIPDPLHIDYQSLFKQSLIQKDVAQVQSKIQKQIKQFKKEFRIKNLSADDDFWEDNFWERETDYFDNLFK